MVDSKQKILLLGTGMCSNFMSTHRLLAALAKMDIEVINVGTIGHIDHNKEDISLDDISLKDIALKDVWEPYMLNIPERPEMPGRLIHDEPSWNKLNKGKFGKKDRRNK